MNTGAKLILIFGIICAVIFTLSLISSVYAHYQVRNWHIEHFEKLKNLENRENGKDWIAIRQYLIEKEYRFTDMEHAGKEPFSVYCSWDAPQTVPGLHIQMNRLGIPTAAYLFFDADGNLTGVKAEMEQDVE